ncbi:HAD family hydrolase [Candidatus Bathyarchaeota archaeon]|nr:HAD family hydrolase [Candidatus Bathyarchaeota archaeon]
MFDSVIFDLERTITDFYRSIDWRRAKIDITRIFEYNGVSVDEKLLASRDEFLSNFDKLVEGIPFHRAAGLWEDSSTKLEEYELSAIQYSKLRSYAWDVLRWVRWRNLRVGVVTLSTRRVASELISKFNLQNYIDVIVGRSMRNRVKPYPDQIIQCISEMGVDRDRVVFIGSDENDLKASKAAGVYTIIVLTETVVKKHIVKAADCIVENLYQLIKFLEGLSSSS